MFIDYAQHSVPYRFLVIKSEVNEIDANTTIIESKDATFFEDAFPMKDRLPLTPERDHIKQSPPKEGDKPVELRQSKRPRREHNLDKSFITW